MQPLASKLRPQKLDQIIGQEHLVQQGKPIWKMAHKNYIQSTILWGPPGTGKTSIIRALAKETKSYFRQINATNSSIKDLRAIIETAADDEEKTLVFVDEIHRFNKAQQDVLLPSVEEGIIYLFGATTENPRFAVNSTILSRCLVLETKPLNNQNMVHLLQKVLKHYNTIEIDKKAAKTLITRCSGDARKLITTLETIIEILLDGPQINEEQVKAAIPTKHIVFDAHGNDHFDLAHCYQEAIQHSDINSAIYWLAKWMRSGEDPAYICRRMLITAFEDCASNPFAVTTAMAACYTVERTGLPEGMIAMSLATCEMANSDRNKSAYNAIKAALHDVDNETTVHVPPELRAGTRGYVSITNKQYYKDNTNDLATNRRI